MKHRKKGKYDPIRNFILLLVGLFIVFFAVINYWSSNNAPLTSSKTLVRDDLYFYLDMSKTNYVPGEDINLQLKVKNVGKHPMGLKFDDNQEFDIVVQKEIDLLFAKVPIQIWKRSILKIPLPKKHTVVLHPGKTRIYFSTWDQTDTNGRRVPPGRYVITGVVNITGAKAILTLRGETEEKKK